MTDANYIEDETRAETLWRELFKQGMPSDMVALRDFDAEEIQTV